jgi:hypothetical protein
MSPDITPEITTSARNVAIITDMIAAVINLFDLCIDLMARKNPTLIDNLFL